MKGPHTGPCAAALMLMVCIVTPEAQSDHVRERDPDWMAAAKDASRSNPLASRPDAAAGGQKVFGQRCGTCHGNDGHGTSRAPDLSAADVQAQTDGALFWKISSGNTHGGMPSFSFLPEARRWQLVLHLRGLAAGTRSGSWQSHDGHDCSSPRVLGHISVRLFPSRMALAWR
jgi:cytochrome c5